MANMNIEGTLGSMFKGMDGFISSKSVVGEPVYVGDTIIIPLVDVNFGMAAGAFNKQDGNKAAGGGKGERLQLQNAAGGRKKIGRTEASGGDQRSRAGDRRHWRGDRGEKGADPERP